MLLGRASRAPPSLTAMDRAHPWWLSAHHVLVECVHWFGLQPKLDKKKSTRVYAIALGTDRSIVCPPFRRDEWCVVRRNRTSRSGSRVENGRTNGHAYTQTWTSLFFSNPPVGIFEHKGFNALMKPLCPCINPRPFSVIRHLRQCRGVTPLAFRN